MPFPSDLPVVDHHCHLSPSGEGVAAARRFRSAGGTHLFLTTQNYEGRPPNSLSDYARQFEVTEDLARRIREEVGVSVYSVVAPYPIDLVHVSTTIGLPAALELQRSALDLAGRWVRERRAVAIGEVGRPHFEVDAATRAACDEAFHHALEVARDSDCPAVVHCEDLDANGYREIAALARAAHLPAHRLIKHYARQYVGETERAGVTPSFLARRELVGRALADPGPWFLETDFLDDPSRPGAVLDLATVPRRAHAIAERSPESAERLRIPFVESIRRVYGWAPEVGKGRAP
ncbi:MAG: TatD family hydrolase [Thermoplasmata archaeon]